MNASAMSAMAKKACGFMCLDIEKTVGTNNRQKNQVVSVKQSELVAKVFELT